MPVALITGGSIGLGRALARELADRGWALIIDGRRPELLEPTAAALAERTEVTAIAGDITDAEHRQALHNAVDARGRLDLLVNNASTLGPSPLVGLDQLTEADLSRILAVNTIAPLLLTQSLLPALVRSAGAILNISSDAAVEHYEGWGGYGAAKAALDHLTLTLAAEQPQLPCYAVDPGDLRTELHQAAFPGEDISDRPRPEDVVGRLIALIALRPASGRYRAAEFATESPVPIGVSS